MDEIRLRVLLERAVEEEPPMGQLVSDSLHAGRRLTKRRRVQAAVAAVAAVGLASIVVPAAFAALRPGTGQRPATSGRVRPTAFVRTSANTIIPIRLSTRTALRPVHIRGHIWTMTTAPGGSAVYVLSYTLGTTGRTYVTRVSGTTGRAGRPVRLIPGVEQILIAPGGRTAYALGSWPSGRSSTWVMMAINLATGAAHRLLAVNPDYVPLSYPGSHALVLHGHILYTAGGGRVAAVNVVTGKALPLIRVQHGSVEDIAIAPDGTNAYVTSSGLGKPNPIWLTPVSLATGIPGTPILAQPHGTAPWDDQVAITPDSRTAYVYGGASVIPVNLVSGQVLKPISVSVGNAIPALAISPTGGSAYVSWSSKQLLPISTATSTAGAEVTLPGGRSESGPAAFSLRGDVLYIPAEIPGRSATGAIIPVSTSTQKAGKAIVVRGRPLQIVVVR